MSRLASTLKPAKRGVNAVIYVGDIPCGGQTSCSLTRTTDVINITNKIYGDWEENLSGIKRWGLTCNAIFIKDDKCFQLLENAFNGGDYVTVKIDDLYEGRAIITSFPIDAPYNDSYTYKIILRGNNALQKIKE